MSEHTPHHPIHPPTPPGRGEAMLVDLVAGDPPVPITVWRTARTDADADRTLPARLAYRLVAAYSRPGEAVVDLTDDQSLAAVCAAGGRVHHRAWFTDSSSLVIAAPTQPQTPTPPPTPAPPPSTSADDAADLDAVADIGDWFGDDLTDPHLPPPCPAAPAEDDVCAATSLVVACWPLDEPDADTVRLVRLLSVAAALLRPGGCLVLVVGIPIGSRATPEDFTPLLAAAKAAGLSYLQHIVAVAADVHGEVFSYHVSEDELLRIAQTTPEQWTVAHRRIHVDLLVLTPATAPPRGRGAAGRDRGDGQRADG